jgi:hypothetical protein
LLLVDPQGNVVQFITYEVNFFFFFVCFLELLKNVFFFKGHAGSSDFGIGNTEYISSPLKETSDVPSLLTELDSLYLFQLPTVSIQLQGGGYCLEDFTWEGPGSKTVPLNVAMSEGEINNNQEYYALPSTSPSVIPTTAPSYVPSTSPSVVPSLGPSSSPSVLPTNAPTTNPSVSPSLDPSVLPTCSPSNLPSNMPTTLPSTQPSVVPSTGPSVVPSTSPSTIPSVRPSTCPFGSSNKMTNQLRKQKTNCYKNTNTLFFFLNS